MKRRSDEFRRGSVSKPKKRSKGKDNADASDTASIASTGSDKTHGGHERERFRDSVKAFATRVKDKFAHMNDHEKPFDSSSDESDEEAETLLGDDKDKDKAKEVQADKKPDAPAAAPAGGDSTTDATPQVTPEASSDTKTETPSPSTDTTDQVASTSTAESKIDASANPADGQGQASPPPPEDKNDGSQTAAQESEKKQDTTPTPREKADLAPADRNTEAKLDSVPAASEPDAKSEQTTLTISTDTPAPDDEPAPPPTPTKARLRQSVYLGACTHPALNGRFVTECGVPWPIPRHVAMYGRKKALCIGINYHGSSKSLSGAANDALNMRDILIEHLGFRPRDVTLLVDYYPSEPPTRKHILKCMRELVDDAEPGDSLFLHYSGHGGQVHDQSGDEADGSDEGIYPVDHKRADKGPILDDELYRTMVENLPEGCQLIAVFDSCHSGSVLDLPYMVDENITVQPTHSITHRHAHRPPKAGLGRVILWSGCEDSQTSAESTIDGKRSGAMSYAFLTALERKPKSTLAELLGDIREILRDRYSQKPQLSLSRMMDINEELFRI